MDAKFTELVEQLNGLDFKGMYGSDFLHTWDKTTDELKALYIVADALRELRENNVSSKIFDSGLAVSLFRDNSTRTRFSFSKAANLLGLELQDLDEKKSQIAHGETVRETATMISFMADVIGIRDDMYIGKGDATWPRSPSLSSRPTRTAFWITSHAHLPAVRFRPPHAVLCRHALPHQRVWRPREPQGQEGCRHLGLFAFLRQAAVLPAVADQPAAPFWHGRHPGPPRGLRSHARVVERAKGYAAESGTTFKQVNTMAEAFEGADIVIPKSWAPFAAMEKRTNLYAEGDDAGIAALEKELLAQNATHQDWCSTTELMEKTANGQDTIFMHPLPADISGVSCEHGEVNADVFDMHRVGMYKEASYKPYAIAAMMFLQKVADPAATLKALDERNTARWFQA